MNAAVTTWALAEFDLVPLTLPVALTCSVTALLLSAAARTFHSSTDLLLSAAQQRHSYPTPSPRLQLSEYLLHWSQPLSLNSAG